MTNGRSGEIKHQPHRIGANDATITILRHPEWQNKLWVHVDFAISGSLFSWVPRQEHQFYLAKAICQCEDDKYPPSNGKMGRLVPARFLIESMIPGQEFDEAMMRSYMFRRSASWNEDFGIEGESQEPPTWTRPAFLRSLRNWIDGKIASEEAQASKDAS